MAEPDFFGEHLCSVCFAWVHMHSEDCYEGEERHPHHHSPALCCPGCPCRSFEEAHPEAEVTDA